MKGVSFLEVVIVIALIGFLSLIGVNSFINFKNDAGIDSTVSELISDIKLARSKSMNGELLDTDQVSDFHPDGLPEYGINISQDSYKIVRRFAAINETGDPVEATEDVESFYINPLYKLSPEGELYFNRITGKSDAVTITVEENSGKYKRSIEITENFVITVTKT